MAKDIIDIKARFERLILSQRQCASEILKTEGDLVELQAYLESLRATADKIVEDSAALEVEIVESGFEVDTIRKLAEKGVEDLAVLNQPVDLIRSGRGRPGGATTSTGRRSGWSPERRANFARTIALRGKGGTGEQAGADMGQGDDLFIAGVPVDAGSDSFTNVAKPVVGQAPLKEQVSPPPEEISPSPAEPAPLAVEQPVAQAEPIIKFEPVPATERVMTPASVPLEVKPEPAMLIEHEQNAPVIVGEPALEPIVEHIPAPVEEPASPTPAAVIETPNVDVTSQKPKKAAPPAKVTEPAPEPLTPEPPAAQEPAVDDNLFAGALAAFDDADFADMVFEPAAGPAPRQ